VPSWRWARPGAWAALIGGAMVASAVATTAWHLGGADNDPGDIVVAEPARTLPASQPPAPHPSASPTSPAPAPKPAAAVGDQHRAAVKAEPAKRTASVRKTAAPRHSSKPPAVPEKAYGPLVCKGYVSFNFTSSLFAQPCHNEGTKVQIRALLTGAAGGSATVSVALQDASTGRNVAGPHTCSGQAFSEGIKQQQCGPFTANPHHGRHYVVVMSWSYNRDGRPTTGTAHGDEFSW
jgi:serine/threonine-protein kinase